VGLYSAHLMVDNANYNIIEDPANPDERLLQLNNIIANTDTLKTALMKMQDFHQAGYSEIIRQEVAGDLILALFMSIALISKSLLIEKKES